MTRVTAAPTFSFHCRTFDPRQGDLVKHDPDVRLPKGRDPPAERQIHGTHAERMRDVLDKNPLRPWQVVELARQPAQAAGLKPLGKRMQMDAGILRQPRPDETGPRREHCPRRLPAREPRRACSRPHRRWQERIHP